MTNSTHKVSITKIAEILDKISEGKTYARAALDCQISTATAYKIVQDFPLWAYFRDHLKHK